MSRAAVSFLVLFVLFAFGAYAEVSPFPRGTPEPSAVRRGLENLKTEVYPFANPVLTLTPGTFTGLARVWPAGWQKRLGNAQGAAYVALQRKLAFERYGLVEAPYDNQGAPLGFVTDQEGRWQATCLACHAGSVAGQTIIGRPNSRLQMNTLIEDILSYRKRFGDYGDLGFREKMLFKMAAYQVGKAADIHSAAGVFDVWTPAALEAKLRNDNLRRRPRLGVGKGVAHEVDPPAWWNVKRKTRYGWDGFAPLTSRIIMLSTLTPGNPPGLIRYWDDEFADILQYIDSIEPPKYPFAIEQVAAGRGRDVFRANCAICHGTYEPGRAGRQYPEKLIGLEEVMTDPIRATTGMPSGYRSFLKNSWLGDFGEADVRFEPANGYVAPPLNGIWASAPYFHNGSAPTLYHVLNPSARPKVWRVKDYDAYDSKKVGFDVEELPAVPAGLDRDERRRYFDTSAQGKSGAGHSFADDFGLDEQEKQDLLEYLKTI